MKITTQNNRVLINTDLSQDCIIAYIEKICKLKGWAFTRQNVDNCKRILEAMAVIEWQSKLFLPIDFMIIYDKLEIQIKNN